MPRLNFRLSAVLPFALVTGLAAGVLGCGGGDGVQTYDAPKSGEGTKPPEGGPVDPKGGDYRILGAMFPAGDPEWFFKMTGPADALTKYEADFDKLLASVSIAPNGPEFTPPEGWKRGPGRAGIVVATIRTPDDKFEVTVTSSRGGVDENVKRWAVQQLGAKSYDLAKDTKPVEGKGVKGLRVDVRGPNNPGGGMGMGRPPMGGKQ